MEFYPFPHLLLHLPGPRGSPCSTIHGLQGKVGRLIATLFGNLGRGQCLELGQQMPVVGHHCLCRWAGVQLQCALNHFRAPCHLSVLGDYWFSHGIKGTSTYADEQESTREEVPAASLSAPPWDKSRETIGQLKSHDLYGLTVDQPRMTPADLAVYDILCGLLPRLNKGTAHTMFTKCYETCCPR